MKAGPLDQLIAFEKNTVTRNEYGEEIKAWAEQFQVWARVAPLAGREVLQSSQPIADMDTRIRVRWSPMVASVDAEWRIQHRGVIYNIVAISERNMARDEVQIMCKSGLNDG